MFLNLTGEIRIPVLVLRGSDHCRADIRIDMLEKQNIFYYMAHGYLKYNVVPR
jgi:hypothetical protein